VDTVKVLLLLQIFAQPEVKLVHYLVGITLQLFGAIIRELCHGRLRRIPVAWPVLIEIGGCSSEPP
jgi:hypothetical protein